MQNLKISISDNTTIDVYNKQYTDIVNKQNIKTECLHYNCPTCRGTGVRVDGLGACIHMISCPCKKCVPYC